MGSTVGPRYVTGVAQALNADLDIRKIGFVPKKLRIFNKTSLAVLDWNDQLAADGTEFVKTIAAGTRTLETTNGITTLAGDSTNPPGFRLGAAADLNDTLTEFLVYEAWG